MAKVMLTEDNVFTLPNHSGKAFTDYTDEGQVGLWLRVFKSGVRSFVLWYRPRQGPRKGRLAKMCLGRVSSCYPLSKARKEAAEYRLAVRDLGADPAYGRTGPETVEQVAQNIIYGLGRDATFKEIGRWSGVDMRTVRLVSQLLESKSINPSIAVKKTHARWKAAYDAVRELGVQL